MRIGLYVRVSTDEQAKEGFSIPAQLRMLNAWAILKNATSVEEYVDEGYSAKNLNRPAVKRLLADCEAHKLDLVVVWRLDRLSRNLRDLLVTIEDVFKVNGVEFVSATENIDTSSPSGRLTLNILGSVAQNERENTSERVTMVMKDLAKQCRHLGGVPMHGLSVTDDNLYVINEYEAAGLRMAVDMRINGSSVNQIIHATSQAGHLTRQGKPYSATFLYEIFRNPKLAGIYVYNRASPAQRDGRRNNRKSKGDSEIITVPGGIPAIIDMESWDKLQMINNKGKDIGGHNKAKNTYLASGLCFCGKCGGKMVIANGGKNRNGSYWRAYRCKNKCVPGIEYRKMDSGIIAYLKEIASDPGFINHILGILDQFESMQNSDANEELEPLRAQLRELENSKGNLIAYISKCGADAPASLLSEIKRNDAETALLRKKISDAEMRKLVFNRAGIIDRIKRIIDIETLSDADKKSLVHSLVERVTVHEDTIDIQLVTNGFGGPDALPEALVRLLTFHVSRAFFMSQKPMKFS